jgi:hypothetical protein
MLLAFDPMIKAAIGMILYPREAGKAVVKQDSTGL